MAILLDTCAAIWLAQGEGLAADALDKLAAALEQEAPIYVSPITAWEIGILISRGRLATRMTPAAWFEGLLDLPGIQLCMMSPNVLMASSFLPGAPPNDPADRIVIATAREDGYQVMTRDRRIMNYAELGHLDVLPC